MTAEILAYGGFGLSLLLAITVAVLAIAFVKSVGAERDGASALRIAERTQDAAEVMRDQALASQKKAEAERDAALAQLAVVSKQRNELASKGATDEAVKVESEPTASAALDDVNRELGVSFVPDVPGAATAAAPAVGADHGNAGSHAVQPAGSAEAGGAGGRSAG